MISYFFSITIFMHNILQIVRYKLKFDNLKLNRYDKELSNHINNALLL